MGIFIGENTFFGEEKNTKQKHTWKKKAENEDQKKRSGIPGTLGEVVVLKKTMHGKKSRLKSKIHPLGGEVLKDASAEDCLRGHYLGVGAEIPEEKNWWGEGKH